MFIAILQHTPVWVWALLVGLTALGLSQTRSREMGLARITVLPLAMLALSLIGVVAAFGEAPAALTGWAAGCAIALWLGRGQRAAAGARWSAATGRLTVPGSVWPLALILGLFALKFGVGVSLALHPALAADPLVAGGCSTAYGLFSGLFIARAVALRRLARQPALQAV